MIVTGVFLYGLAVIPFTYCLSFLFASASTAQNVMILIYVLGGEFLKQRIQIERQDESPAYPCDFD